MSILRSFVVCACAALLPIPAIAEPPTVKIGMAAPLTGAMAFYGKGWSQSAQLALDEVKDTHYRYELKIEDSGSTAAESVTAFRKLSDFDHADVVLSASANMALALAPLARTNHVLHVGISSDSSFADGQWNFNLWPAPYIPADKLIEQFKKRGVRRIAIIGLEHAWPRAIAQALSERVARANITISMNAYFDPGERDFRPLLTRLAKSGADIAVLLSWPPELERFAHQYQEMHVRVPLTADWSFDATSEPALFNGFWFVSLPLSKDEYQKKFAARFGYAPYSQMELGDVDIRLLVAAYEAAGDGKTVPAPSAVAAALLKIKNQASVFGPISINASGVIEAPYVLKEVRDGKVVQVE